MLIETKSTIDKEKTMTYTPKNIRKTLKKCITEVSLNPESFVKIPGKDFTRERKLSFE